MGGVLALERGRRLAYEEYGDPQGTPLFFFHGWPGSRLEGELADPAAKKLDVRVIAADRPGYGLSDFVPRRTFLDWPADVLALAAALGFERFAVAGVSGGGPYVAACALRIPERLTGAGIIAGVGPFDVPDATVGMSQGNRFLFGLARRMPWLARPPMSLMGFVARHFADRMMRTMIRSMPEPDQAALARPEMLAMFKKDSVEAFRSGSRGAAWELVMYSRSWGFRLEEITMEVHLWQGELDKNVPPSMGRYQAGAIPNCRATFYAGEGHYSLPVNHLEEILGALVGRG
ncbi:MAG: alpha/beta hydrolase [Chloroflexi bacterium]|nr:alpha/beta hydrolase [Chloroflexota bacterium]